MQTLASYEQLTARLGVAPVGNDVERAVSALEDASALVRSVAGQDWIDDHDELEEVPAIIEAVTLAVAFRAYQNPQGIFSSQVGDVSVSYGREGNGGSVFLTRDERASIRRAVGGNSIGSIELISPYSYGPDVYYVPVFPNGDPLPMAPPPWDSL